MVTTLLTSSTKKARASASVIFVAWQEEASKRQMGAAPLFLREPKQPEDIKQDVQERGERER